MNYDSEGTIPPVWNIGDVILGRYEVKQVFKSGGMGLVYRVRHIGWNMDLAVKSPRPEFFAGEQQQENFERECETWIQLGLHPHVVSCYYVRRLGGIPRVFAEYVDGGSLADWIRTRRLCEGGREAALRRILDIGIQFAWGLKHAHEKGLVHRDVKPGNVMMTQTGIAKVSDFGLAKARAQTSEPSQLDERAGRLVSCGSLMTIPYRSPEQAAGDELSTKTDVWSWAASIFEMFAGQPFWLRGELAPQALEWFLRNGETSDAVPRMPPGLVELLRSCFRQHPKDRWRTAGMLADELAGVYAECTGKIYLREEPREVPNLADGLNNRAVSVLDLGGGDFEDLGVADALFSKALELVPHHPEATYNRGLLRWRSARITDEAVLQDLDQAQRLHEDTGLSNLLVGQIHLERGEGAGAMPFLQRALNDPLTKVEAESAVSRARDAAAGEGRPLVTFEGHRQGISAIAVSPDERWMLSASEDQTVRLWEVSPGRCCSVLRGHESAVTCACFAPNGELAASASPDKTIRLWNLSDGTCVREFEGHSDGVNAVAVSPDGRWLLTGGSDHTIRIWDVATGKCSKVLEGHSTPVRSVCFAPDGRHAFSGGDMQPRLWDIVSGQCVRVFEDEGVVGTIYAVCLSANGRWGLSAGAGGVIRLWSMKGGFCFRRCEGHIGYMSLVNALSMNSNAKYALSGGLDRTARFWDLTSGRCIRTLSHAGSVRAAYLSQDGRWGLTGDAEGAIKFWTFPAHFPKETFAIAVPRSTVELGEQSNRVAESYAEAKSALGKGLLAQAAAEISKARQERGYEKNPHLLNVWRELTARAHRTGLRNAYLSRRFDGHIHLVKSVFVTTDGRFAVSGSHDSTVRLWDLETGHCLQALAGYTWGGSVCRWLEKAVSLTRDKKLHVFDPRTGESLRQIEVDLSGTSPFCIQEQTGLLLSAAGDSRLRLWNLATGEPQREFPEDPAGILCVCMNTDARLGVSGNYENEMHVWDLAKGECLRVMKAGGSSEALRTVCFAPSGTHVLSAGTDGMVRLWDLETGTCLKTCEGHDDFVISSVVSSDGRWALSGSEDRSMRLWDLATGKCVRSFEGHAGGVETVCFSHDCHRALSGSSDKTLRLWELEWDYEFPEASTRRP